MRKLKGMRVAILVCDGFEQSELVEPRLALEDEGAECDIVSPAWPRVRAWKHMEWGRTLSVDVPLAGADARDYDALLLPGGVMNPDKLRLHPKAIAFIKAFVESGKPIAAICHGPWTLIDAGAVRGKTVTSWPSLQADLHNAGAVWVDREVVRDDKLVTSRKPDDIPAFSAKTIEMYAESPRMHVTQQPAEVVRT
ncbi:MAG TPA: type 1 glutamine amidotransferase domain-containing protein [Polyangiaceae bacterium]